MKDQLEMADQMTPFVRQRLNEIADELITQKTEEFRQKLISEKANILVDVLAHIMYQSHMMSNDLTITIPLKK